MRNFSINPYSGKTIASFNSQNWNEIIRALERSKRAEKDWSITSFEQRANLLKNVAAELSKNREHYAKLITQEMGKILVEALLEIDKCAWVCTYYAEKAEAFLSDKYINTEASESLVTYKPLGTILAVMPWNFPFWQVFRFAAPALMAGNTVILKHASNVLGCGLAMEKLFLKTGIPEGVFQQLILEKDQIPKLIESPQIKAVTLTGSEKAGASVASKAALHIKKAVLELGGNDAYIILEDADLNLAAKECAKSRLLNAGQSCIGAKRFVVLEAVYKEFMFLFKEEMGKVKLGDPLQVDTTLGPMARLDLRDELHQQVEESIQKGAMCTMGGFIPDHPGAFYPPTILENVQPGMPAYHEELFGPVASVIQVKTEEEAIQVANDSIFGLGSCVFTQDVKRGKEIAQHRIQAGACFVNSMVKSDPRLPFGGIKKSGYGRELAEEGIKEFVNCKTVYMR